MKKTQCPSQALKPMNQGQKSASSSFRATQEESSSRGDVHQQSSSSSFPLQTEDCQNEEDMDVIDDDNQGNEESASLSKSTKKRCRDD